MNERRDWELLRKFVDSQSQEAFSELTRRYLGLVFGTALRELGDRVLAEDVTQAVFLILARKASTFRPNIDLVSWLFDTSKFTAKNASRNERRRRMREQKIAVEMQRESDSGQSRGVDIGDLTLNQAISALPWADRKAVLLRYVCGYTYLETGVEIGVSEDAARMRVGRALGKLRRTLTKAGFGLSVVAIAENLQAQSAQAASAVLEARITDLVFSHSAAALAGIPAHAIAQGALKSMTITNLKIAAGISCGVILAGGTIYQGVAHASHSENIVPTGAVPTLAKVLPNASPLPATSEPKALALALQVRKTYASLATFSCTEQLAIENPEGNMLLSAGEAPFNFIPSAHTCEWQWSRAKGDVFTVQADTSGDTGRIFDTQGHRYCVDLGNPKHQAAAANIYALTKQPDTPAGEFISYDSPIMVENLLKSDSALNRILSRPDLTSSAPIDFGAVKRREPIQTRITLGPDTEIGGVPVHTLVIGQYIRSTKLLIQETLSVGIRDDLARQIVIESSRSGANVQANRYTFTFRDITANPSILDDIFSFVPPPGAREIKYGLPADPAAAAVLAQMERTYRQMRSISYDIANVYWSSQLSMQEESRSQPQNPPQSPNADGNVRTNGACLADSKGKWEFHLSANPTPDQGNTMESEQVGNWVRGWQANVIDQPGADIQIGPPSTLDGQAMEVIVADCGNFSVGGGPTLEHSLWTLFIGHDDHLLHRRESMSTFGNGEPQWRLDQTFSNIKVN